MFFNSANASLSHTSDSWERPPKPNTMKSKNITASRISREFNLTEAAGERWQWKSQENIIMTARVLAYFIRNMIKSNKEEVKRYEVVIVAIAGWLASTALPQKAIIIRFVFQSIKSALRIFSWK
jgi:hypothetical protein